MLQYGINAQVEKKVRQAINGYLNLFKVSAAIASPEDVYQDVIIRLIESDYVNKYDASKGVKFGYYLSRLVKNRIMDIVKSKATQTSNRTVSLHAPISSTSNSENTLEEVIPSVKNNIEEYEELATIERYRNMIADAHKPIWDGLINKKPYREIQDENGITLSELLLVVQKFQAVFAPFRQLWRQGA